MIQDREILVLYSTAVCNLNCRYCYIDKNPSLIKIDELLDKSFLETKDYYFNFAKKIFLKEKLKEVQIWGGEPSIRLDRTYFTIKKLIEYYPNLTNFMMSSNLATETFFDQFYGFLEVLGQYPERKFTFQLQLSIDGPSKINDLNRGKGVTEIFTKNFLKLLESSPSILNNLKNITLKLFFKPTLDASSIKQLQRKKDIIKYYQFFEIYQDLYERIAGIEPFISFDPGIPNTACPSPHTVEDGKLFANLVKLTREIEQENLEKKYFKFYKNITPFGNNRFKNKCDLYNCGICGTGKSVIGLLPNEIISTCHNGFTQLLSDYKIFCMDHIEEVDRTIDFNLFVSGSINNDMVFSYEKLSEYEKSVESFYNSSQSFILQNYIGVIQFLAMNNQVDLKYNNFEDAKKAAIEFYGRTCICLRDHIGSTGSKYIPPVGLFKLLLNGAMDYLIKEE